MSKTYVIANLYGRFDLLEKALKEIFHRIAEYVGLENKER